MVFFATKTLEMAMVARATFVDLSRRGAVFFGSCLVVTRRSK